MVEPRKTYCWLCGWIGGDCHAAEIPIGRYIYTRPLCPTCRDAAAEKIERMERLEAVGIRGAT